MLNNDGFKSFTHIFSDYITKIRQDSGYDDIFFQNVKAFLKSSFYYRYGPNSKSFNTNILPLYLRCQMPLFESHIETLKDLIDPQYSLLELPNKERLTRVKKSDIVKFAQISTGVFDEISENTDPSEIKI